MKKIMLSLLLAGVFLFCCACAGNAPDPVSIPEEQSAEPVPEVISSVEPAPESSEDESDIVQPYPAATPEDAVQFLEMMSPGAFNFVEPFDNFEVKFVEEAMVEGGDCYRMEMAVSYPGVVEVLTLFIRTDLGVIYHFDDESGIYHEIIPYDYYCPQESPENGDEMPQGYPEGGDDAAIGHLMLYNKDELNLPAELSEYVLRVDGEMEVNGIRCSAVGVYADLGKRMELMGTYYVAFDNSSAYATDLQTGGYKELPVK